MSAILALARPELLSLPPAPVGGEDPVLARLHANESPWAPQGDRSRGGIHRYPDPQPAELVAELAALYRAPRERVLVCRGGDEAIDVLVRVFCRPGIDAVFTLPPTFGQYALAARLQGARVETLVLERERGFALDPDELMARLTPATKVLFLCSPNNPTGHVLDPAVVERACRALAGRGLVVHDEAYVEFAGVTSLVPWTERFPNLVVLRTLSKAHALAGARIGTLIGAPELVDLLARALQPFSLSRPGVEAALDALAPERLAETRERVRALVHERERLRARLAASPLVKRVFPSRTNFLLVETKGAALFHAAAARGGAVVRGFAADHPLADCVRVTVGAAPENHRLLEALGRA
jgi:histidinol-phosphate aminotransferase